MLPRIERVLSEWLASGARGIGQVLIVKTDTGFVLCHREDEAGVELEIFRLPNDAIEIARLDDAGQYRALKTAPNLRHGWRLELADLTELRLALDGFYPGRLTALAAWEAHRLETTPLRETLRRQSGMYRAAAKISDNEVDWIGGAFLPIARRCARMFAHNSLGPRRDQGAAFAAAPARQVHRSPRPDRSRRKRHAAALPGSMHPARGRGAQRRERVSPSGAEGFRGVSLNFSPRGPSTSLGMTYRARTVVTMDGPPIDDGAVAVAGDRIAAVGRFEEIRALGGSVIDLGEVIILPGLINAHCHLDFTSLRGGIRQQRSFADWILQINRLRRDLSDEDFLVSIALGFAEARRWGTTTIANIESMPALLERMAPPPLRTWWFAELIDVRPGLSAEEMIEDSLSFLLNKENWPGGVGLSPHAPYTASPRLTRLAAETANRHKMLLTTHLAESNEEMEMFRHGRGRLFELLESLGRPMDDCGAGKTPLAVMLEREAINDRWIVVHLNELAEEDLVRLESGPRFHIAHCPRSSRYFQHRPFAMQELRDLRFNICLGTDSLASNSSLSLFAEMQTVRDAHRWLEPERILEMVTSNSARALDQEDVLGKIRPGFQADLIALPIENGRRDIFEKIIAWSEPVPWMLVAGVPRPLA